MSQPILEVNMEVATTIPPTMQQPKRTVELEEGPLELGVGDKSEPGYESESKGDDPEQQTESDYQPPQQTAPLRKLNNTWTRSPPTVLSSRTRRSGGTAVTDGHEAALNLVLASDSELKHEIVAHEPATNLCATKATLVKQGGHGNDLPPEPQKSPLSHGVVRVEMLESSRERQRWVASSVKESACSAPALRER